MIEVKGILRTYLQKQWGEPTFFPSDYNFNICRICSKCGFIVMIFYKTDDIQQTRLDAEKEFLKDGWIEKRKWFKKRTLCPNCK